MTDRPNGDRPVLARSLECRVPRFTGQEATSAKAERLADHILETSFIRAELADLRMNAHISLRDARREWGKLTGWEPYRARSDRSQKAEDAAKALMKPELADRIADAEWTIARCSEEMERLDKDATRCNQGYDILTGG